MWSQSVCYTFNYNLILFPVGIVIKYFIKSSKYKYMLYYIKFLLRVFDKVIKIWVSVIQHDISLSSIRSRHQDMDICYSIDIFSSGIRCSHHDMVMYYSF
jgi:hypothetical protein